MLSSLGDGCSFRLALPVAAIPALVTDKVDDTSDFLALARTHYENFPVGSWLVPREHRPHIWRIYAFARVADDLADERQDAAALAAFRAAFIEHLSGEPVRPVPLLADLVSTIETRRLPPRLFFDLLDAFALDLEVSRHDEASLLAYCRKSADPVGRLVLRVFGHDEPRLDAWSDRLCTGLQLLNHLQDIGEDLRIRDRVYFPREDLVRFGVDEDRLRAPTADAAVRALVGHWHARVTGMFRDGWPLLGAVHGRLRLELRAICWGAVLCLRKIAAQRHDVLAARARLKGLAKASLPLRALLGGTPRELR
ncbi:MAG: squalene synthase HpnC [Planctomycetota bacterium]